MTDFDVVKSHYSTDGLLENIESGLRKMGKSKEDLDADDLIMVDEFHLGGRLATVELLQSLNINRDSHVLDIGSGLGGPARVTAVQFGARVTGIDLSEVYTEAGGQLNRWLGLNNRIDLIQGNALELPFEENTFDCAYSIHVSMNIEDKAALFSGIAKVLRPGAKLGLFDILKGNEEELVFPVPWADDSSTSFLVNEAETKDFLSNAGFEVGTIEDETGKCLEFINQSIERMKSPEGPPPLGLHTLLGPTILDRIKNVSKNLESGTIQVYRIVAQKK